MWSFPIFEAFVLGNDWEFEDADWTERPLESSPASPPLPNCSIAIPDLGRLLF